MLSCEAHTADQLGTHDAHMFGAEHSAGKEHAETVGCVVQAVHGSASGMNARIMAEAGVGWGWGSRGGEGGEVQASLPVSCPQSQCGVYPSLRAPLPQHTPMSLQRSVHTDQ